MIRTLSKRLLYLLAILSLTGCAWFGGGDKDEERERARLLTEQQLYERIQGLLDKDDFELAVRNLQLLESRFPFGVYAEQAQLEIVYAYFQNGDKEAAIAAAERFLRLHPNHPDADYAWYMKGLANYALEPGLFARFSRPDHAGRDVETARRSFREFQEFLARYPESLYAADARVRMLYIKQILARHELIVANYYVKRQAYVAAINRGREVIDNYQRTEAVADALALLAYCYYQLDVPDLAEQNVALLVHNYPDHPALGDDGEFLYDANYQREGRSWLNRVSFGLLDAPRAPRFDSRG